VPDLSLRPLAGSDLPSIAAMWERCTPATRMSRFHAPVRDIPASYLKAALADPAASVVAAPERTGVVVAVASLIRSASDSTAELGVLVQDAWQRRGIGHRLVGHLITAAPARGIAVVTAAVLTQNATVADLLRQVPGEFSLAIDGPALNVQVRLASAGPRP
jgi:L-amino acid N-acyltransferase YncA